MTSLLLLFQCLSLQLPTPLCPPLGCIWHISQRLCLQSQQLLKLLLDLLSHRLDGLSRIPLQPRLASAVSTAHEWPLMPPSVWAIFTAHLTPTPPSNHGCGHQPEGFLCPLLLGLSPRPLQLLESTMALDAFTLMGKLSLKLFPLLAHSFLQRSPLPQMPIKLGRFHCLMGPSRPSINPISLRESPLHPCCLQMA